MKNIKQLIFFLLLLSTVLTVLASCGGEESGVVDLSLLSTTMAYSELENMTAKPDRYLGKTVKMRGAVSVYRAGDNVYYSCTVSDLTACCSQALEFVLEESQRYPAEGSEVVISGVFDTYQENGSTYCYLKHAVVE